MSISLRNMPVRFYTASVANDGGYASTSYVTDGVYWFCRLVETRGKTKMSTGQEASFTAGVLELADEVPVVDGSLCLVNGRTYVVRGIRRVPERQALQLTVEWTDQPLAPVQALLNGVFLLDGSLPLDGSSPLVLN